MISEKQVERFFTEVPATTAEIIDEAVKHAKIEFRHMRAPHKQAPEHWKLILERRQGVHKLSDFQLKNFLNRLDCTRVKVNPSSGCRLFTDVGKPIKRQRELVMVVTGIYINITRMTFERFRGPLFPWERVHRVCGNHRCIAPAHLVPVSRQIHAPIRPAFIRALARIDCPFEREHITIQLSRELGGPEIIRPVEFRDYRYVAPGDRPV